MIRRQLLTALIVVVVMTVALGFVYPLVVTGRRAGRVPQQGQRLAREGQRQGRGLVAARTELHRLGRQRVAEVLPAATFGSRRRLRRDVEQRLEPRTVEPEPHRQRPRRGHQRRSDQPVRDARTTRTACRCRRPTRTTTRSPTRKATRSTRRTRTAPTSATSNTVPERAMAYRQLNGLAANAKVPVDAVTTSGSGLDPDISIANAELAGATGGRRPSPPARDGDGSDQGAHRRSHVGVPRRERRERARAQSRARQARVTEARARASEVEADERTSWLLVPTGTIGTGRRCRAALRRIRDGDRRVDEGGRPPLAPPALRRDRDRSRAAGDGDEMSPSSARVPTRRSSSCRRRRRIVTTRSTASMRVPTTT